MLIAVLCHIPSQQLASTQCSAVAPVWEGRGAAAGLLYATLPPRVRNDKHRRVSPIAATPAVVLCASVTVHLMSGICISDFLFQGRLRMFSPLCCLFVIASGWSVCLTVLCKHLRAGWIQQLECMHMSTTMRSSHRIPELWCAVSSLCKSRPVHVLSNYAQWKLGCFSHLVLYDRHPHNQVV